MLIYRTTVLIAKSVVFCFTGSKSEIEIGFILLFYPLGTKQSLHLPDEPPQTQKIHKNYQAVKQ